MIHMDFVPPPAQNTNLVLLLWVLSRLVLIVAFLMLPIASGGRVVLGYFGGHAQPSQERLTIYHKEVHDLTAQLHRLGFVETTTFTIPASSSRAVSTIPTAPVPPDLGSHDC